MIIKKLLAAICVFLGFLASSLAFAREEVDIHFDQRNAACDELFSHAGLTQRNLTLFADFDLSNLKSQQAPELINDDFNLYRPHLRYQNLSSMKYSFSTMWNKPEEIFLYGQVVLLSNLVLLSRDGVNWESYLILKDTKTPEHCALIGEGHAFVVDNLLPSG